MSAVVEGVFPEWASGVATEKRQTFSAAENSEAPWCGFPGAPLAADAVPAANTSVMMHAHAIQSRRQLVPLVVAPAGVPIITDPKRAKQDPELAVLSVMAHGRGDVETAVQIALSAAQGTAALDEDTRVLYFDLIEAALGEAARKAFEMLPQNYEFQGPTFKKGKLEGQTAMAAAAVLDVLDARGIAVSDVVRERVQSSTDLDQLRRWHRRAVVLRNIDELLDE